MDFAEQVILITGATSPIGADAARHFSKLGAKAAIVGRNEQRLNEVVERIEKYGASKPLVIVADVTKDAERIVNETIKHFGRIDVLLNNAGPSVLDNILSMEMSEFDEIFNTNTRSAIILSKLCVPHLEKTKGNIVNVSSVAALSPVRNLFTYSISKAALDQFTKCAALDLAPKGIRVNSINPAQIRTPILETIMSRELAEQWFEACKVKYPIGRIGEVSDTSAAIAFFANKNAASFLNGISLKVDGGFSISGCVPAMVENQTVRKCRG